MKKSEIRKLMAGLIDIKKFMPSPAMDSVESIIVVTTDRFMNIGNLKALEEKGFVFKGAGVTDDGDLYIAFGSHKQIDWAKIGREMMKK